MMRSLFDTNKPRIYAPDGWNIIKVKHNGNTFYKVFGSFGPNNWRLSSGADDTSTLIESHGVIEWEQCSGSTYQMVKRNEGLLSDYARIVLFEIIDNPPVVGAELEVISYTELLS